MRLSVRGRLALWLIAGVFGLLAISGFILLAVHDRVALQRLDAELRRITETVGAVLQNELDEGLAPREAAEDALGEVRVRQRDVAIFNEAGDLLASRWTLSGSPSGMLPPGVHTIDTPVRARLMSTAHLVPTGYVVVAAAPWVELDQQHQDLTASIFMLWPPVLVVTVGGLLWVFRGLLNQLEQVHDARRRFLIDASHELRTPVTVARTAADLALSQPTRSPDEYRDALSIIAAQMRLMTRLVGDMLALARTEASEWAITNEELYVDDLIEQVARDMRVLAAPRQVAVQSSCPPDLQFYGDRTLLRQMVTNLAENAVRHTTPLGEVRLSVRLEETAVEFLVSNQGDIIRPDDRDRIFEPFVRAGGGAEHAGLGLGLAIVRRIARLHGGEASLLASARGTTTFSVRLPIRRPGR